MKRVRRFINDNPATMWMAVFIICFYALYLAVIRAPGNSAQWREQAAAQKAGREAAVRAREASFAKNLEKHGPLMAATGLAGAFALLAGVGVNAAAAVRRRSGRPLFSGAPQWEPAPWRISDVLKIVIAMFFIEVALVSLETAAGAFVDLSRIDKDVFLIGNSLVRNVGTAILVIFWVRGRLGRPLSDIGLTARQWPRRLLQGLAAYVATLPWLAAFLAAINVIAEKASYEPEPQAVFEIYMRKSADAYVLPLTLFVALVGPVIEEVFFRGFTYRAFRTRWGLWPAAWLSSLLFAVLHMNVIAFFPILFLGVYLAYLYERTGSLVPSMTVHALHNFVMVALTLSFKTVAGHG